MQAPQRKACRIAPHVRQNSLRVRGDSGRSGEVSSSRCRRIDETSIKRPRDSRRRSILKKYLAELGRPEDDEKPPRDEKPVKAVEMGQDNESVKVEKVDQMRSRHKLDRIWTRNRRRTKSWLRVKTGARVENSII